MISLLFVFFGLLNVGAAAYSITAGMFAFDKTGFPRRWL